MIKTKLSPRRRAGIAAGWVLVAVCMAVIFYLSAQPSEESAELSEEVLSGFLSIFTRMQDFMGLDLFRTCAHWLEYCGLGALLFHAFFQTNRYARPAVSWAIAAAYSLTDEIHQIFVPGRACQITDILVDFFGAAVGVAVCCAIYVIAASAIEKKRRRKVNQGRH